MDTSFFNDYCFTLTILSEKSPSNYKGYPVHLRDFCHMSLEKERFGPKRHFFPMCIALIVLTSNCYVVL